MQVRLLQKVQNDLQLIQEFHPKNGKKIVRNLLKDLRRLESSPKLGASLSYKIKEITDYRYLLSGNFLIFYKIKGKLVKVYRIYDDRQDWLNQLNL